MTNECHVPFVDPTTVNAPAVAISAGGSQNLALRADGTVAGWPDSSIPAGMTNISSHCGAPVERP